PRNAIPERYSSFPNTPEPILNPYQLPNRFSSGSRSPGAYQTIRYWIFLSKYAMGLGRLGRSRKGGQNLLPERVRLHKPNTRCRPDERREQAQGHAGYVLPWRSRPLVDKPARHRAE